MADKGWISLHRSIQDCPIWYGERFSKGQAWVDLLLLANHKDKKILFNGEMVTVKRGQYMTSTVKLSEKWGWSRPTVVKFLKLLESDKMITRDSDNTRTLITIENYEVYQRSDEDLQPILQPPLQPTLQDSCNPINNPLYTNNNDNNLNNDNNTNKGGVGENYSYEKNSNVNNFLHCLETHEENAYINSNPDLMNCLKDWFGYKDNKKPKSNNHYGTKLGMEKLLKKVVDKCKEYGVQAVVETINDTIANNYQGIVWNWLEKKRGNYGNTKPERRNTRTDDVEIDEYTAEIIELMREQQGMQ